MSKPHDFEERARHLREATERLAPPAGLGERIVQAVTAQRARDNWTSAVVMIGKRGLLFAALLAAASVVFARASERDLEEAIALATLLEGP